MRYYISCRSSSEEIDVNFDHDYDYLKALERYRKAGWEIIDEIDTTELDDHPNMIMAIMVKTLLQEAKESRRN